MDAPSTSRVGRPRIQSRAQVPQDRQQFLKLRTGGRVSRPAHLNYLGILLWHVGWDRRSLIEGQNLVYHLVEVAIRPGKFRRVDLPNCKIQIRTVVRTRTQTHMAERERERERERVVREREFGEVESHIFSQIIGRKTLTSSVQGIQQQAGAPGKSTGDKPTIMQNTWHGSETTYW